MLAQKNDLYLISDEIYDKLTFPPNKHVSIAQLSEDAKERTIIVNGWSRTYGMTGWRPGYILSNSTLAKAFRNFQGHTTSNVCAIAQRAAPGALRSDSGSIKERFQVHRDLMVSELRSIEGIELIEPGGAFYIFPNFHRIIGRQYKNRNIDSVETLCALLLEKHRLSIVPGAGFGVPNNARISYAVDQKKSSMHLTEFVTSCRKHIFIDITS